MDTTDTQTMVTDSGQTWQIENAAAIYAIDAGGERVLCGVAVWTEFAAPVTCSHCGQLARQGYVLYGARTPTTLNSAGLFSCVAEGIPHLLERHWPDHLMRR